MDMPAYQQPAAVKIIRDRRGVIVGTGNLLPALVLPR